MKNTNYPSIIHTDRLLLRQWNSADLEPFADLNADPRVMEYFPATLSRKESDALAERIRSRLEGQGWGLWAVSIPDTVNFIGFIGLSQPSFDAHFTPAVEVGWRLAFDYWGKGYATEGATAVLAYGFDTLKLEEIVSFTAVQNQRSRHVMEKIGMHHSSEDDFDHPKLPEGHPLRRHVLYRKKQQVLKNKYVYKPYSNSFPILFLKEKERIASSLINAFGIEHIGSSAIPGLGGKGIIDIAISVHKEEMEGACRILQSLGYEFNRSFSTTQRFYFIAYLADPEEGTRRYHIHLTHPFSAEWNELLGFRDYLRAHPHAVEEYVNIKKQAVMIANEDGERYRKIKEPFIQKIKSLLNS